MARDASLPGRSELRILFAFDPARQAILLVAGDKAGNWKRWYRQNIPAADDKFDVAGLTQEQLAERLGVSQRQVSKIERGDVNNARVGMIRGYVEAVGGDLALEIVSGDSRIQVA